MKFLQIGLVIIFSIVLLMYKITEINGIKTYNMSAGKTTPQFLEEARKKHKSLRYNQQFKRRIELIQDFSFEISTNQVQISPDQRYIVASGIYGPQIKIFDTKQLSLKCLRGLDSEVIKFAILSDDYSKIAMAQHDRSIQFHAQYGAHYKTRIPSYPRDIVYNPIAANLCVSASANQIYRISLQQGKFMAPFHTNSFINTLDFNSKLNLLVCGGQSLEIWDFRQRDRICQLKTSKEITALKCDPTGLQIAIGQGSIVNIFDVRFNKKLMTMKSSYNEPINCINFLANEDKNIVFSNKKQIKICKGNGDFFTAIQPEVGINSFSLVPKSGFIMAALQDPKIGCYFVPQLGSAPQWVPYIENITEQLEQQQKKMVYDEYKFVSKQEVYQLGCTNLINTKMLREYMHGYLMHLKLYNKVKNKLQGQNYIDQRKKMIERQVEKNMPKRIQKVQQQEPKQQIVVDPRFGNIMEKNPEAFAINRYSDEYIVRHPHLKNQLMKQREQENRKLERLVNHKLKIAKQDDIGVNNFGNDNQQEIQVKRNRKFRDNTHRNRNSKHNEGKKNMRPQGKYKKFRKIHKKKY